MGARYSKQQGFTVARTATRLRQTQRTVQPKVSFGPTAAKYFGLALLAVIALVMLTQQSTRATSAYKENDLRKSVSQVQGDVESLKMEARRAQSLENLHDSPQAKAMQPIGEPTYVEKGQVAGVATSAP